MVPFGKAIPSLVHFQRRLRGGSQPILADANNGLTYVVKFSNNLQGPNLLFNESMGTELYRACGLPVPDWTPLSISDAFLDRNRECWMEGPFDRIRPSSGLSFGSRLLGDLSTKCYDVLPVSWFPRIQNLQDFWLAYVVDTCAAHADRRQAVFLGSEPTLTASFIDHGHMFGGPDSGTSRLSGAPRYSDPRIYSAAPSPSLEEMARIALDLNATPILRALDHLPERWQSLYAVQALLKCLDRLSDTASLRGVLRNVVHSEKSNAKTNIQFWPVLPQIEPRLVRSKLQEKVI